MNNQNTPKDNVQGKSAEECTQVKTVDVQIEMLKKFLEFTKGITASIVYEDSYDFSKGIKGAEVDYLPETIEELACELNVKLDKDDEIISDKHVDIILRMTNNYGIAQSRISELEAENKKLREAVENAQLWILENELVALDSRVYQILKKALNNLDNG